jgi:hypothetical protein
MKQNQAFARHGITVTPALGMNSNRMARAKVLWVEKIIIKTALRGPYCSFWRRERWRERGPNISPELHFPG